MTTLDINFPHKELTKLSNEDAPTSKSLLLLHKEVYANARSVESQQGGGAHGHLGLVMPAAPYLVVGGTAWNDPVNPGVLALGPATTSVQIATASTGHATAQITYHTTQAVGSKLKSQLLVAVPNEFLNTLEDPVHGFSDVTAAEMLAHLTTSYGTVTPEDLKENEAALSTEWNPNTPTELVFDNATKTMAFATTLLEKPFPKAKSYAPYSRFLRSQEYSEMQSRTGRRRQQGSKRLHSCAFTSAPTPSPVSRIPRQQHNKVSEQLMQPPRTQDKPRY